MFALSPQAIAQQYRLETREAVASTNALAAEFAKSGDGGRLWVVAREQTQGKGRRGRVWHSPRGNLYASLLLLEAYTPQLAATLGFVAGVSLVETMAVLAPPEMVPPPQLQLKWPNDVLINGVKSTGILLERLLLPNKEKSAIIVGMGVNVARAPEAEYYPTTSLKASGFDAQPAWVFERLSHFWTQNFALWDEGRGLDVIRQKWLKHAIGLGQEVHVLVNGTPISGIFTTIDQQGQLLIKTEEGATVAIPAGDVHFGSAATWRPAGESF